MRIFDPVCSLEGCDREHYSHGYCRNHLARWKRYGDPYGGPAFQNRPAVICSVAGCDRRHYIKGYCRAHWQRFLRTGDIGADPIQKEARGSYDKNGYRWIVVPEGTWGAKKGQGNHWRIQEHWDVMQRALGRPLLPDENIHHKNGIRDDNRLENLELWVKSQPYGARATDLVEWAHEILRRYEQKAPLLLIKGGK